MTSSEAARTRLDRALRGELSVPDAVVLDLDLGAESGYELLRSWYRDRRLSAIPLVVWSRLGENHQAICDVFKIKAFVFQTRWAPRSASGARGARGLAHQRAADTVDRLA